MHNQGPHSIPVNTGAVAASSESFYAALSDIGQLLVRSLEPLELYEAIIEVLERRIGALLVMVGEVDHANSWFRRIAPAVVPAGMQDIYPEHLPFSVAQPSFWQGTPQLESDSRHAPGLEMFRQAYVRHGVASVVAVPVMKFGEVTAALVIRSSHASFFSTQMIELLQQAGASIGLGLEAYAQRRMLLRAVREEARQRRALRLLSEMIKVVTRSADERVLLADSCAVAHDAGGYRFAWIGLLEDDEPGVLRLRAHAGLSGSVIADDRCVLADPERGKDAAVIALSTGQPGICHLPTNASRDWPLGDSITDLHAILALPLRVDGVIVGAFVIGATRSESFTPVETQVFLEMAVELGLGMQIQRARAARLVAEQDLQFNLQHFHTILSSQHAGLLVMSNDGVVKFANQAFCALYGFTESPADLEGCSASTI